MNSESWLNEEVYVGTLDTLPRRTVIWTFTKYGIEPFIKSHGYVFHGNTSNLSCGIATLLYRNRGHTLLCPYGTDRENDYSIEHKQHYNHVLDYKAWENFWAHWSMWEDVSLDSQYGFYRRIDIQEYIWSQLNLDLSAQTQIVEDYIDGHAHEDSRDDVDES